MNSDKLKQLMFDQLLSQCCQSTSSVVTVSVAMHVRQRCLNSATSSGLKWAYLVSRLSPIAKQSADYHGTHSTPSLLHASEAENKRQ